MKPHHVDQGDPFSKREDRKARVVKRKPAAKRGHHDKIKTLARRVQRTMKGQR